MELLVFSKFVVFPYWLFKGRIFNVANLDFFFSIKFYFFSCLFFWGLNSRPLSLVFYSVLNSAVSWKSVTNAFSWSCVLLVTGKTSSCVMSLNFNHDILSHSCQYSKFKESTFFFEVEEF